MLSPEVLLFASKSVLCWRATVDQEGQPNVSPKEIFTAIDSEYLVIANIASPTSVRNLEINPRVCVSFIDVFVQKGFKVFGTARNVRRHDEDFALWSAPLEAKAGPRFPIHSVVVVRANSVEPILAPSYRLYAVETTEQAQVASAMRAYGVRPSHTDGGPMTDQSPFVWHELVTPDQKKSGAFFSQLFGWTRKEVDAGKFGTYTLFQKEGQDVAGMMNPTPETPSGESFWHSYIAVENVDECAKQAPLLGGSVVVPPHEVPDVGRVCIVADPTGAIAHLMQPIKQ